MTISINPTLKSENIYLSSDGQPIAETYTHLYAILLTLPIDSILNECSRNLGDSWFTDQAYSDRYYYQPE